MDYAALATKYGGSQAQAVDYASLAAKYGGSTATTTPNNGAGQLTPPATTPPPQPTTAEKVGTGVVAGLKQAGNAGLGALKSIPAAIDQVSQLGQRALGKLTGWLPGMPKTAPETPGVIKTISTPTNQDQQAGFLGGQLATTFAAPTEGLNDAAADVAGLANAPEKVQPLLNTAAKAVAQGGAGAVMTKLQGGTDKQALEAGAGSAAFSAAGDAVSHALQDSAEKSYSQALGATTKTNKALSDKVVPGLLDRGTIAMTREGLASKAAGNVEQAGDALEQGYASLPKDAQTQWGPVLDTLQQQKNALKANGVVLDQAHYTALDNIQKDLMDVAGSQPGDPNPTVSVESARSARQILDKAIGRVSKTFGMTGQESAQVAAQKSAANAIRSQLAEDYPDIGKLNKEFSFWSNVQQVVGDTVKRTKAQSSLAGELATDTGAIIGSNEGGGLGNVVGNAFLLKYLHSAVTSTGWRTISAVAKDRLADLLTTGQTSKAITALQEISAHK